MNDMVKKPLHSKDIFKMFVVENGENPVEIFNVQKSNLWYLSQDIYFQITN